MGITRRYKLVIYSKDLASNCNVFNLAIFFTCFF